MARQLAGGYYYFILFEGDAPSSSSSSESSASSSSSSESSSSSSLSSSSSGSSSSSSESSSSSSESSSSSSASSSSSSASSSSNSSSSSSESSSSSSESSSSSSESSSSSGSSSSSSSSSTGPPDFGFDGDVVVDPLLGDLITDSGAVKSLSGVDYALESAVLISLFTDKRAKKDDPLPEFDGSRRGWWGDQVFPDVDGDEIGSHLWLLERSKTTQEVLVKAKYYIDQALRWMIEDKIVVKYDIEVERNINHPNDGLFFRIQLYKRDGTRVAINFEGNYGVKLE